MPSHHSYQGLKTPAVMVQKSAERTGRLDGRKAWMGLAKRGKEQRQQHLDSVQVLLAHKGADDVRIKLSSTGFFCVHSLILRCKAVLDSLFRNYNISVYKQLLRAIADALQQVLALVRLGVQDAALVTDALITMAHVNVDFADASLAELDKAGGLKVATFDQDFRRLGRETLEF